MIGPVPDNPLESLRVMALAARDLPAAHRDAVFLDDGARRALADAIVAGGLQQVLILSTCDRLDICTLVADNAPSIEELAGIVAPRIALPLTLMRERQATLEGADALRHLFAVAASLDSETVGDSNVLGQLKAAHREARAAGHLAPPLEGMLQAAYASAKRIRSGTSVGALPVSLASIAGTIARDIFGEFGDRSLLLIGDGEMGLALVRHFAGEGIGRISVAGDDAGRAQVLAARLDAHVESFDRPDAALSRADIVIAATAGRQVVLERDIVRGALRQRKRRPMFLIDAALPPDIDPAVDSLDGVFRYDLGDLERAALENRSRREISAAEAWALLDAEIASYLGAGDERSAVPLINALRGHFEEERRAVLADTRRAGPEEATRLLVNRLLHGPVSELRDLARNGKLEEAEMVLRDLFSLDTETGASDARQARRKGKGRT